jgi:hypothetical protein
MSTSTSIPACTRIADDGIGPPRPVKNVISFDGSPTYLPELMNWVAHFWRVCKSLTSLYIICNGKQAVESLTNNQWGLKCDRIVEHPAATVNIWYSRTEAFIDVLKSGYDVFATDLDALWITDPYEILNRYPGYDVIAQRAVHFDVLTPCSMKNPFCAIPTRNTWGSDMCFGIVYFRSSPGVLKMLEQTKKDMKDITFASSRSGDQVQFSQIFHRQTVKKMVKYDTKADIYSPEYATAEMKYHDFIIKVASIPQQEWPHDCKFLDENHWNISLASVVHCNSHAFYMRKNEILERYGLWILTDDWENMSYDGVDYDGYIKAISNHTIKPHATESNFTTSGRVHASTQVKMQCAWYTMMYPSKNCPYL